MTNAPPASSSASSDSQSSATRPVPSNIKVDDVTKDDQGVRDVFEKKPELEMRRNMKMIDVKPEFRVPSHSDTGYKAKIQRHEAYYTRYLMSKYFSNKDMYGDEIFEGKTVIGGETIKSSRFYPTDTFFNPVMGVEEESSSCSSLTAENGEDQDVSSAHTVLKKEE